MAHVANISIATEDLKIYNGSYVVERGQMVTLKIHVTTWANETTPKNAYAIVRNNGVDYKGMIDEAGNTEISFPVNGKPDQVTTNAFVITSGYLEDSPRTLPFIFSDETEIKQSVVKVTAFINEEEVRREGVYLERDQVVTLDVKAYLSTGQFWEGAQVGVYNNNTEYLGDLDVDGNGSVTFQVKGKQGMDTSAIYVFVKDHEREATLTIPVKFTNTTDTTETSTEEPSTTDTTTDVTTDTTTDTAPVESSTTDSTSSTVDSTESVVESSTEQTVTDESTSTDLEVVETTETSQVAGYTESTSSSTESKEVKETHTSTTEPTKELPSTGTEVNYGLVGFGGVTLAVVMALVVKKLFNK